MLGGDNALFSCRAIAVCTFEKAIRAIALLLDKESRIRDR